MLRSSMAERQTLDLDVPGSSPGGAIGTLLTATVRPPPRTRPCHGLSGSGSLEDGAGSWDHEDRVGGLAA